MSAGGGGCVGGERHVRFGPVGQWQGCHAECLDCGLKPELPVAVRKCTHLSNLM